LDVRPIRRAVLDHQTGAGVLLTTTIVALMGSEPGSGRSRARCASGLIVPACVVLCGLIGTSVLAQTSTDEARKKRDAEQRQLTEQDRKAGALQVEMTRLDDERGRLNTQLLDAAKRIQASEAQQSAIEHRKDELEAQKKLVEGSLEGRRGSMSGLLAAMQRMGRNPPPVLVTRREDALSMVRSAMLIAAAFPELRAQAQVLSEQLSDLVRITDGLGREEEKLRVEKQRYAEASVKVAALRDFKNKSFAERQVELVQAQKAA
jgi:murein hydrolase activator